MTKILSWNVNGLRAIYKKGFLDWVDSENADIICLQETKAHPDQLPKDINPIKNYYSAFFSLFANVIACGVNPVFVLITNTLSKS